MFLLNTYIQRPNWLMLRHSETWAGSYDSLFFQSRVHSLSLSPSVNVTIAQNLVCTPLPSIIKYLHQFISSFFLSAMTMIFSFLIFFPFFSLNQYVRPVFAYICVCMCQQRVPLSTLNFIDCIHEKTYLLTLLFYSYTHRDALTHLLLLGISL